MSHLVNYGESLIFASERVLECDECGEQRSLNGVTIIGEIHGCPRLGAFRLGFKNTLLGTGTIEIETNPHHNED